MNAKQQWAINQLGDKYVTELNLNSNAFIASAIRKVTQAKTVADSLTALDYLLFVINKAQDNN